MKIYSLWNTSFFQSITLSLMGILIIFIGLIFTKPAFAHSPLGRLRIQTKEFKGESLLQGVKITVSPNNYSGLSKENGELIIENILPFRNYQIKAELEGYTTREVGFVTIIADQETKMVVPLTPKASLGGKVKGSGKFLKFISLPCKGAVVILGRVKTGLNVFEGIKSTQTDWRGNFNFGYVDEGKYKIVALKEDAGRSELIDINAQAGKHISPELTLVQKESDEVQHPRIIITKGPTDEPQEEPYYAPAKLYFSLYPKEEFQEFYWIKERQPDGTFSRGDDAYAGDPKGSVFSFTLPSLGNYTISVLAIDREGITRQASLTFEAVNIEPEAVSSVIPGPSELPLIDGNQVYTSSSASSSVLAGAAVYLRGFGVDVNLVSPEEFNPKAPAFDLYETKNGNFKASLFSYKWALWDKNGLDASDLLSPSANSENVFFQVPAYAQSGDTYEAVLTIIDEHGASSKSKSISITIAEKTKAANCANCHYERALAYTNTAHARSVNGAGCQDCHGPGSEHISLNGQPKLSVSFWPGVCGQCHLQFGELQKANHSDPLSFGYYEPTDGRLVSCYRCHYTPGYIGAIESGIPFHQFHYGSDTLTEIPKDTPNVSCSICHDPHCSEDDNPYGLRAGQAGGACDTCHYEKWQNAVLEGMAGEIENGYHYPDQDYSSYEGERNPHRTEDKCVLCHLSRLISDKDERGVRKIGGHTLRMRDFGPDQIPGTPDDLVNYKVCQRCHEGLPSFDRHGLQTEIKELLAKLSHLLKENNHGFLPANQPGNCAKCHKGGTVPFLKDTNKVLEQAYTNYKLILNDRSYGIHNPGYVKKLLQDSLRSVSVAFSLPKATGKTSATTSTWPEHRYLSLSHFQKQPGKHRQPPPPGLSR